MRLDTGFRPSKHGFDFSNEWRDVVLGVVPSRGRCGGMVFAALDAFAEDRHLPSVSVGTGLPGHGEPVARLIWRRQVDSVVMRLGANLWQFARFTYLPTESPLGIAAATRAELLPLFDALRAGWPVPLGLVSAIGPLRLAANHQVLAYAAEFGDEDVEIAVYDPNHPGRDDVTITVPFAISGQVTERVGASSHPWRGLFIENYSPRTCDL